MLHFPNGKQYNNIGICWRKFQWNWEHEMDCVQCFWIFSLSFSVLSATAWNCNIIIMTPHLKCGRTYYSYATHFPFQCSFDVHAANGLCCVSPRFYQCVLLLPLDFSKLSYVAFVWDETELKCSICAIWWSCKCALKA